MNTIWKNLPDEIINNVMEYWCPNKERKYRQIEKLILHYYNHILSSRMDWAGFKDTTIYIKKIMEYTNYKSSNYLDDLWITNIKFTNKSVIYEKRHTNKKSIIKLTDECGFRVFTCDCRDNYVKIVMCMLNHYRNECINIFNIVIHSLILQKKYYYIEQHHEDLIRLLNRL